MDISHQTVFPTTMSPECSQAAAMTARRFPPPWTVITIPGGFKVVDAQGQSIAYVYSRETPGDANIAGVLTENEARRIASNIAKLPVLLGAAGNSDWDFPEGGG
jgi:hypothetical protein